MLTQARRKGAVRPHEFLKRGRHGLREDAKHLVHRLAHRLPHFGPRQGLQDLHYGLRQQPHSLCATLSIINTRALREQLR